jgi:hypothetical protein
MPTIERHIVTKHDVAVARRRPGFFVTAICGRQWKMDTERDTKHDPLCEGCKREAQRVGLPLDVADRPYDGT